MAKIALSTMNLSPAEIAMIEKSRVQLIAMQISPAEKAMIEAMRQGKKASPATVTIDTLTAGQKAAQTKRESGADLSAIALKAVATRRANIAMRDAAIAKAAREEIEAKAARAAIRAEKKAAKVTPVIVEIPAKKTARKAK